jgi:hypothetical protein
LIARCNRCGRRAVVPSPAGLPRTRAAANAARRSSAVETGRHDLARLELEKIEAICGGRSCEQYVDLAEALAEAP